MSSNDEQERSETETKEEKRRWFDRWRKFHANIRTLTIEEQ